MEEHVDRLMDALLREQVGGEYPPNLSERILAAAVRRRRRRRLARGAWAAAAALILAVGAWWVLSLRYPGPTLTGCELTPGQRLERGLVLATGREAALLTLGGYCAVRIAPESEVQWGGAPKAEEVLLHSGIVECTVDRDRGAFCVRTDVAVVSVTGTQFTVKAIGEKGAPSRRLYVKVESGSVVASGDWGDVKLDAGEESVVPPRAKRAHAHQATPTTPVAPSSARAEEKEGRLIAILTARGTDHLLVKEEGEAESRRYVIPHGEDGADKEMAETLKKLYVANLVDLEWALADGRRRVRAVRLLVPPEKSGEVTGVVTAKGDRWVDVKPDGEGPTERYTSRWVGGREGGPDRDQLRAIVELKKGGRVRVLWQYQERKLIVELSGAGAPAESAVPVR
jgi:hypothetical protein